MLQNISIQISGPGIFSNNWRESFKQLKPEKYKSHRIDNMESNYIFLIKQMKIHQGRSTIGCTLFIGPNKTS